MCLYFFILKKLCLFCSLPLITHSTSNTGVTWVRGRSISLKMAPIDSHLLLYAPLSSFLTLNISITLKFRFGVIEDHGTIRLIALCF